MARSLYKVSVFSDDYYTYAIGREKTPSITHGKLRGCHYSQMKGRQKEERGEEREKRVRLDEREREREASGVHRERV
jgi:hypothetical protein